jgi:hypothetical protein
MQFPRLTSKKLRGVFRVALFLACVNVLVTALYLPRARAAAEKFAVSRGLAVLKQLGPLVEGSEQAMSINGQRMFLASRVTPLPLDQVLGLFERDCQANSGGLSQELGQLPVAAQGVAIPAQMRDPARWFTLREEDGRAGQVTCFVRTRSPGGLRGLVARLATFAKSGDLAELGDAHYVVAQRVEGSNLTHVLALWTEGHFNVLQMFPASGDAPGADSTAVPRPPNSVRVLSAEAPDRPYALRMYDSSLSASEILSSYSQQMQSRGWARLALPKAGEIDLDQSSRTFTKAGRAVILVVNSTPEEKSGVNLIELGSAGFATVQAELSP